jgi:hypothetical protein
MPHAQLVGEEAEQLARLVMGAGRQGQQIMHRREFNHRRLRLAVLRHHHLHRVYARVVVAVVFGDDTD